jgi:hypothetical protein
MTRFYIHIGLPRCASTMIETVFLIPEEEGALRLGRSGILPLRRVKDALRAHADEPVWSDAFIDEIRATQIDALDLVSQARGLFVSEEGLTLTYHEETPPPDIDNRARCMLRLAGGFEPHIIMFVRNQVAYIESLYALHVQGGGIKYFLDFVNSLPMGVMDWHAVATSYANVFGRENMTVLPLEKDLYPSGGHSDFLSAFQAVLEVANPLPLSEVKVYNPSLPTLLLQVQQQINERIDREQAQIVADTIRSCFAGPAKQAIQPMSLFTPDQQQQVKSSFAESNKALFADYMPGFDPSFYLPA